MADGLWAWVAGVEGAQVVVAVAGELDAGAAKRLSRWFERSVKVDPRSVIIDLEHLEFLDAGGIEALLSLGLHLSDQRRTVSLRKPQPIVRQIITIAGLLHSPEAGNPAEGGDVVLKATSRHVP